MSHDRPELRGANTPWGRADQATEFAPGILFYSTPSHGGFHLNPARMAALNRRYPGFQTFAGGPWFEEDCDACIVVVTFPEHFDSVAVESCAKQIRTMATASRLNNRSYTRFSAVEAALEAQR